MTCAPSAEDGTPRCEPAGTGPTGAACQSWTDCAPGMICAGGACRKLCCGGDWTGCPEGEHCLRKLVVQLAKDAGTVDSKAFVCVPVNNCDVLVPTSCGLTLPGVACLIADPTGATACLPEGTGLSGGSCPCKGGFTCVNDLCRRLCKAVEGGGEPSCPTGEGPCVHFNSDPPGVGECTPRPMN